MKVPQTFTIDIDDAAYLASLPRGRRSEWIRTAIKMQRLGRAEMYEMNQILKEQNDNYWQWIMSDMTKKRWQEWDDWITAKQQEQD